MLRITIELIPNGDPSKAKVLGSMDIINDGTGSAEFGNYRGELQAEYGTRKGRLTGFNRQHCSAWSLVGGFLKLWGHTKHSPKQMEIM